MPQARGVPATSDVRESEGPGATASRVGGRESVVVFVIAALPVILTSVLITIGVLLVIGWQRLQGQDPRLPTNAHIRTSGLLLYSAISWIEVAYIWLWASRRGLSREIFAFRRPMGADIAAGIMGFLIAMYGVWPLTRWLIQLTHSRGPGVRVDLHDIPSLALYLLCFVATAPICEEILYRGLLVARLRRVGWPTAAIWLIGSLVFGGAHLIYLGYVWSIVMVPFGAMLFGLRLWRRSLTPGWIVHFLFNAQPLLAIPLISRLAPALLP